MKIIIVIIICEHIYHSHRRLSGAFFKQWRENFEEILSCTLSLNYPSDDIYRIDKHRELHGEIVASIFALLCDILSVCDYFLHYR